MTIDELNALITLTAADEVPVWDSEESGEPTKKITAQNFASSIKTLASLLGTGDVVNNLTSTATDKPLAAAQGKELNKAIAQSTATVMGVDIPLVSNAVAINPGTAQTFSDDGFKNYKYVDLYFEIQGGSTNAVRLWPNYTEKKYKFGFFAWNDTDNALRRVVVTFTSAGRYLDQISVKYSYNNDAFADANNILYLVKAVGYAW